jgi:hypothetical protein
MDGALTARITKSEESIMKKRIMMVLAASVFVLGGNRSLMAVDALFSTYYAGDFEGSTVNTVYSDNSYGISGCCAGTLGNVISWQAYPYPSGASGWIATNLVVVYSVPTNTPEPAFVNCVTNCGSFVANAIFMVYSNTTTLCEAVAQPLTGATNGIGSFTNLAANGYGVCFLPNGSFIIGGAFKYPGGYADSINLAQVSAEGVVQDITFQALDGVVTNLTYDSSTGYVLVQGTFTEVKDSINGLVTGVDGATGIYWEPSAEEFYVHGG